MAAGSSSSTTPTSSSISITQQEFNMFHNIDRQLFMRLILGLGREQGQAMQIVALFIWLEQAGKARNLVANLVPIPDTLLNSIADEAVLILNCIENENYVSFAMKNSNNNNVKDEGIPLIQSMTTKPGLSLKFLHDNRFAVLRGVTRNLNEVCVRAFRDIVLKTSPLTMYQYHHHNEADHMKMMMKNQLNPYYGPVMSPMFPPVQFGHYGQHHQSNINGLYGFNNNYMGMNMMMNGSGVPHDQLLRGNGDMSLKAYELEAMKELVNEEIGDMLNRIKMKVNDDEDQEELPQDERTVFLTFSKGYPTSEEEVREFFTRNFAECIETIVMQEVDDETQPLYARLVLESAARMDDVLQGAPKRKFSINGKHVWARKFVRKTFKPPSLASTALSQ